MPINLVYLSLGSNLGDREGFLREAVGLLTKIPGLRVTGKSSLYETDPVGFTEQDRFLNAVVQGETSLTPEELLRKTQEVENSLGRKRTVRWGPRTMDIDILLFNQEIVAEPELTIPHPEMFRRRFVLAPLAELAGGLCLPGRGEVRDLLAQCPDQNKVILVKKADQW